MVPRFTKRTGPFTDPWNLETAGVDSARDYYRQQNDQDVANGDVLGQAVHMGQAAQATIPDPMGLKGLMQALSERGAVAGRSLDLPNSPMGLKSTYDPSFQTTAKATPLRGLSLALTKGKNGGVR